MNKVLFIGLDAIEPKLVQKWAEDGSLPTLKKLIEGGQTHIVGYPEDLVVHPWSNFYTGQNPGAHGIYHYICWDPLKMKSERFSLRERGQIPFWRTFDQNSLRVIAVDMPMVDQTGQGQVLEAHGWATHEILQSYFAHPPEFAQEIKRELGPHMAISERYGLHTPEELIAVNEELISMTLHGSKIVEYLLQNKEWDLFLTVFNSLHLGGHKLTNLSGIKGDQSVAQTAKLNAALKKLYQLVDRELGKILSLVPENTQVIIASFHGMGPSTSRVAILQDLIDRIVAEKPAINQTRKKGLLSSLRELIPIQWRHAFKSHLPIKIQDKLTSFWRIGGTDWSKTPAFGLVSDFDGFVRINLKGRERDGIVNPGDEYEYWIERITNGLHSFSDQDSGKPLIRRVIRREAVNFSGRNAELFPDIFIQWADYPCAEHRMLTSPQYGNIPWPTPGLTPDGRSGNHLTKGIVITSGGQVGKSTNTRTEITVQDVTATIYDLLELALPDEMIGHSIIQPKD